MEAKETKQALGLIHIQHGKYRNGLTRIALHQGKSHCIDHVWGHGDRLGRAHLIGSDEAPPLGSVALEAAT
jgi:hypothetical protein